MFIKTAFKSTRLLNTAMFRKFKRLNETSCQFLRFQSGPGSSELQNLKIISERWTEKLKRNEVPEAELSVKYIIENVLGMSGQRRDYRKVKNITLQQSRTINDMCVQRLMRKPIQYIIGEWDFRHLTLTMKPPVFIPRSETEDLVDIIAAYHLKSPLNNPDSFRFLEVGCGSGAICLSLLSENQQTSCVAIDVNPAAVSLTKLNGMRNKVEERLSVINVNIGDFSYDKRFDAIISNPPYISSEDIDGLQPEVNRYEDEIALCGGNDGMDIIKMIFNCAPHLLKPNGSIWFEMDLSHPLLVRQFLLENPFLGLRLKGFHNDFTKSLQCRPVAGILNKGFVSRGIVRIVLNGRVNENVEYV